MDDAELAQWLLEQLPRIHAQRDKAYAQLIDARSLGDALTAMLALLGEAYKELEADGLIYPSPKRAALQVGLRTVLGEGR